MKKHRSKPLLAAFTLVELLVVVGIVSVLISILMPTLSKAREHANRVVCAAHLRAQGQALIMYVQQYRFYPAQMMSDSGTPGINFAIWPTRLRMFTGGDHGVFYCPSQDERCRWVKVAPPGYAGPRASERHIGFGYEVGEPLLGWAGTTEDVGTYFSYGYNRFGTQSVFEGLGLGYLVVVGGQPPAYVGAAELRANRVRVPSDMIAIADSSPNRGWYAFTIQPHAVAPLVNPGRVHGGGANVLFCDGHVQWYLQRDLLVGVPQTLEYERVARIWNNTNTAYPTE